MILVFFVFFLDFEEFFFRTDLYLFFRASFDGF